jgi:hypothetical protein
MENQVTYFNRHENMDSETRSMILETIKELSWKCECNTFTLENWLYGLFDGYDYSGVAIYSKELAEVTRENAELGAKISEIFGIIEKYSRTLEPNHNIF